MRTYTTATNPVGDWTLIEIELSEDRAQLLDEIRGTEDYRSTVKNGIDQGWIQIIGEFRP